MPYAVPLRRRESVTSTTSTLPLPSIYDDSRISRDILVKSYIAETVETKTYQHYPYHECCLHKYCTIGGRFLFSKREEEWQCPTTSIVSMLFADDFLPCQDVETFCRRIGADPTYHYRNPQDYMKFSPYQFTLHYGKHIETVRDDNVIINKEKATVIKFLRNISGIKSFLVGAYASSHFNEQLGLAKCVAFYPDLMCAEFEYVGHNLAFAIKRSMLLSRSEDRKEENDSKLIDYENVSGQISTICKRLECIGGLIPESLKVFNFCITKDKGKVVLCCLDRFGHMSTVDKHEDVVESLLQQINPKLYRLFTFPPCR